MQAHQPGTRLYVLLINHTGSSQRAKLYEGWVTGFWISAASLGILAFPPFLKRESSSFVSHISFVADVIEALSWAARNKWSSAPSCLLKPIIPDLVLLWQLANYSNAISDHTTENGLLDRLTTCITSFSWRLFYKIHINNIHRKPLCTILMIW